MAAVPPTIDAPAGAVSEPDKAAVAKPLVEISPERRSLSPRQPRRRLWDYREVLWAFTVRAVKVKYKQAVVGGGAGRSSSPCWPPSISFALIFGRSRGRFDGR